MGLFNRDTDRTERFLSRHLEKRARKGDRDASAILLDDEKFSVLLGKVEGRAQESIDQRVAAEKASGNEVGGSIVDFFDELVNWVLTHQDEIKQLIAFVISLFAAA